MLSQPPCPPPRGAIALPLLSVLGCGGGMVPHGVPTTAVPSSKLSESGRGRQAPGARFAPRRTSGRSAMRPLGSDVPAPWLAQSAGV